MISLDQAILDPHSPVAERMRGLHNVDIIIPSPKNSEISLSENVKACGTGGNKISQFFRVIKLARQLQARNSYDLITTQDPFMTALVGLLIRRNEQLEIQVHGDFFSSNYFRKSSFKNYGYYWLARVITVPLANKIRVVGERVKQSMVTLGVALEKIEVRPVFINTELIAEYVPKKDIKKDYRGFSAYFGYFGRLELEKNVEWLLELFDQYLSETGRNDVLIIVGDGSQKNNLQEKVRQIHRENNIIFVGWVVRPLDYLKTVDCVLVASEAEGYGLIAMEAVAAGIKLITTDVGVAQYELLPSDSVHIVPVADGPAFIAALKNVI